MEITLYTHDTEGLTPTVGNCLGGTESFLAVSLPLHNDRVILHIAEENIRDFAKALRETSYKMEALLDEKEKAERETGEEMRRTDEEAYARSRG